MFVCKINISFIRQTTKISESLVPRSFIHGGKIDTIAKRGSMLKEMIANKDKRKNWHLSIIPSKPKARTFDKIHKPHRRRAVLNSLFIRNVTDVLSTGEIVPEIVDYGVEITGVQVSPCCKILNVFWQVPISKYDSCEDIGQLLNIAAPKIRAELISRNVLGRVPFIYFLRDSTNDKVAAFEQAMQKLESEPQFEPGIIADDSFTKDLYLFKDSKLSSIPNSSDLQDVQQETKKENEEISIPKRPLDMKCNVFGLDHSMIMEKVVALKKKTKIKPEQHSALISPESLADEDIFSKIPGVCFRAHSSSENKLSREAIFKQFHIQRKRLMEKNKNVEKEREDVCFEDDVEEEDDMMFNSLDEDFIEEETRDNY